MRTAGSRTWVLDLRIPDVNPLELAELVSHDIFDREDWGDCFSLHQESIGWDACGPGPLGIVNRRQYRADSLQTPTAPEKFQESPKPIDWDRVRRIRNEDWQKVERQRDMEAVKNYLIPIWIAQGEPPMVIWSRIVALFNNHEAEELRAKYSIGA